MKPKSRYAFLLLFLFLCPALLGAEVTPIESGKAPGKGESLSFYGESLDYDIAFLWFDRLAKGRLSFGPGSLPDSYEAVLEAQTLGVASWLTGNRAHRYVSTLEEGPDGKFRSLIHESQVLKGKGDDRRMTVKRYLFDYGESIVHYQRRKDDRITVSEVREIDRQSPPSDILTAFFNLRAGAFGALEAGETIRIPTFSHKKISDIVIYVIPPSERQEHSFFPQEEGILLRVTVDPDVFDTGGGNVYVWFDEQGRPARGIVENVIGLGNVRGILR